MTIVIPKNSMFDSLTFHIDLIIILFISNKILPFYLVT